MRVKIFAFFICYSLTFNCRIAVAQTTAGTDFWLGFMENFNDPTDSLWIYITADRNATGTVNIPQTAFSQFFSVAANSYTRVRVPNSFGMNTGYDSISNKGIHITASDTILVIAFNRSNESADGSVVFPLSSLTNEYITMNYKTLFDSTLGPWSEFIIVATDTNTQLQIIPTDTCRGWHLPEDTIFITLNAGQSYQIQSGGDLTGSKIKGNKSFAVFSGNQRADVPNALCCADHLYEQMLPTNQWSSLYLTTPLKDRNGDTFRFLAKFDSTVLYKNGTIVDTLNSGEFMEQVIYNPKIISANKPFAAFQFANSQDFDFTIGDPLMIQLQGMNDMVYKSVFKTHTIDNYFHYINIITKSNATGIVYLNGVNILSSNFSPISNSGYSYASLTIPDTIYILQSDSGFIAYQYGFSYDVESYGYALSGYPANISTSINEIKHNNFYLNISPNPFSDFATINLPFAPVNTNGYTFIVFDASGNRARTVTNIKTAQFIFSKENLNAGIYLYVLYDSQDNLICTGKFIIENKK